MLRYNLQFYGGRGASSRKTLKGVMSAYSGAGGNPSAQVKSSQWNSKLQLQPFQTVGDYDGDGNPQLIKWQSQTDDKSARYLAKVDKETDLSQYQSQTNDPYAFYDNPYQKMVAQMGLNKPATVMSASDFDKYVQQTGSTVIYRGWSGQNAVDRFKDSPNSHVGNGINGDGYYWATDSSTARKYGGTGTRGALSPDARVISLDEVNRAIANASPQLRKSLSKAGSGGTRTYGANAGQAQMALKMGYNTIDAGWAVIPLTRDAVVISDTNAW